MTTILLLILIAGLLLVAGLVQEPIREDIGNPWQLEGLDRADIEANPELAALSLVPGGARIVILSWLWVKMQSAHIEGRHHDAYELSRLICKLEPYYPGAWTYCAWNMAWNVSVETNTKEERWQWVYNGIKLLRDEAIPKNPRSLTLYYELGWIFFMKIGGRLDNYHWKYKQRFAKIMNDLLGAPPFEDRLDVKLSESIEGAINAFRPIAEAPLDKSSRRRGREMVQTAKLQEIIDQDPRVGEYLDALGELGVRADMSFLEAYNRFSRDMSVDCFRVRPPTEKIKSEKDKKLFLLINNSEYIVKPGVALRKRQWSELAPQEKLLSFVRAQILWNKYHMDPSFMLEIMEGYGVPLDWRHSLCHGLYWFCLGLEMAKGEDDPTDFKVRRIHRNTLNCLKTLSFTGLIDLRADPSSPDFPVYTESQDLRFIDPTHRQHLVFINEYIEHQKKANADHVDEFSGNTFAAGHYNYLGSSICVLTADGRIEAAQKLLDYVKKEYETSWMDRKSWEFDTAEDFTANFMKTHKDIYGIASTVIRISLKRALLAAGLRGDMREYKRSIEYASRLYHVYTDSTLSGRMRLPVNFRPIITGMLMTLIWNPQSIRLYLTPAQRSDIYLAVLEEDRKLQKPPGILAPLYFHHRNVLQFLSKYGNMKMQEAFPAPPFLEEYKNFVRDRMKRKKPTDGQVIENEVG